MHNVQANYFYHQLPKHFILLFFVENWTGILVFYRTIILVQCMLLHTSIFSIVFGSTMTFCFISNGTATLVPAGCPSSKSCRTWRMHSSQRLVGLVRGRVVFTEIPTQHTSGKDRISGALMAARPVYSGMGVLAEKKPHIYNQCTEYFYLNSLHIDSYINYNWIMHLYLNATFKSHPGFFLPGLKFPFKVDFSASMTDITEWSIS